MSVVFTGSRLISVASTAPSIATFQILSGIFMVGMASSFLISLSLIITTKNDVSSKVL